MSEDHLAEYDQYNIDPPIHSGASGKGLTKKDKINKEHMNTHSTKEGRIVEDQITNSEQKQKAAQAKKQTGKAK